MTTMEWIKSQIAILTVGSSHGKKLWKMENIRLLVLDTQRWRQSRRGTAGASPHQTNPAHILELDIVGTGYAVDASIRTGEYKLHVE